MSPRVAAGGSWPLCRSIYRAQLAAARLCDPHDARRVAIEAGRLVEVSKVVLIGAAELPGLTRALAARLGDRLEALIAAPAELSASFDEFGAVISEAWRSRSVPVELSRWYVADDPEDAARGVAHWVSQNAAGYSLTDVTIGLADPGLATSLAQEFALHGVPVHDPSGTALSATGGVRLLRAVAAYLESDSYASFAALLRHPDMEAALGRDDAEDVLDAATALDRYHTQHLPARLGSKVCPDSRPPQVIAPRVQALASECQALLGELAVAGERSMHAWAEALREFLMRVYRDADLAAIAASGKTRGEELQQLAEQLEALAEVPVALFPGLSAAAALSTLADACSEVELAPAPDERPSVEMLGWLELALDDAPLLALAGLDEGCVSRVSRSGRVPA